jgi:4-amino-4-deoxy-L-arabinose transferase-like glycosyltransferase
MTTSMTAPAPQPTTGPISRQTSASGGAMTPAFVLLVTSILLLFDAGRRVFATNDDARFPLLARDIVHHGHWLLPRLDGAPHLNKPPGFAWLIAVASWPGGDVTQWTAAMPSLLAALATVALTYWIARTLFDPATGGVAAAIVATMYGTLTMARVPMPDMALCAVITGALAAYVRAESTGHQTSLPWFYLALAAAFWIKGPPGLLPLAVVLTYATTVDGSSGVARLWSVPGATILASAIAAWWVLSVVAAPPDFVDRVVLGDLLFWYVPTRWRWRLITEPIAQALTVWLPWSPLVPLAVLRLPRSGNARDARARLFVLAWLTVMSLLVSVTAEQRMRYHLVLCPPAAVAVAVWLPARIRRWRTVTRAAAWLGVAVAMSLWQRHEVTRHNAGTAVDAMAAAVSRAPAPLYAIDAPELVFEFHLERSVTILPSYAEFARRTHDGPLAYLIVPARALPAPPDHPPGRVVALDHVNHRVFAMLGSE